MYDATNPLWREEHHYTGERRGPEVVVSVEQTKQQQQQQQRRRQRFCQDHRPSKERDGTAASRDDMDHRKVDDDDDEEEDPWFPFSHSVQGDDEEESYRSTAATTTTTTITILDRILTPSLFPQDQRQRQFYQQQQQQQHHGLRRGGGSGRDPTSNRKMQAASLSTTTPTSTTAPSLPHSSSRKRLHRPFLSIQRTIQQQKIGTFDVDFSNAPRIVPSPTSRRSKRPRIPRKTIPNTATTTRSSNDDDDDDNDNNNNAEAAATSDTTAVVERSTNGIMVDTPNATLPQTYWEHQSSPPPPPPTTMMQSKPTVQMALSLDPSSMVTLLRTLIVASTSTLAALFATIQLVGPMILAKRIVTTLGYIFYDHYNGRYLRTTYTRRMQHMQEFEVIASARALGRFVLQVWTMALTGSMVGFVMDHPWMPTCCWFPPNNGLCHLWYGMVWMGAVYMAGWGMGVAMKKEGYSIHLGHTSEEGQSITKYYVNPLSIRPTFMSTSKNPLRRRQQQRNHDSVTDHLLRLPRQVLQWMREPEESMNSLFRFANQKSNHPIRPTTPAKQSLDRLLFPSTFGLLRLWSCLTIIYAIAVTLSQSATSPPTYNNNAMYRVMKTFIIQETFHYEWYRVFVKERRIALGAIIGMIGTISLLRMTVVVASIDKLAGLALIPMLIAEVVTWYMNTILYFDHYLPSVRPPMVKSKSSSKRHGVAASLQLQSQQERALL